MNLSPLAGEDDDLVVVDDADEPVLVRGEKDMKRVASMMAALPGDRKKLAKKYNKLS